MTTATEVIEPKPGTQHYLILQYLRAGNRLTGYEAIKVAGTMKLASRISDLKKMGHIFQQQLIETNTGKWVMQYWMEIGEGVVASPTSDLPGRVMQESLPASEPIFSATPQGQLLAFGGER